MNIIKNTLSLEENSNLLDKLTDIHLKNLLGDRKTNKQKILEVCHVGKFLTFFNNELAINNLSEKPDFIISKGDLKIGLEHQIIVNELKEKEGFIENVFSIAEREIQDENNLPNFLANCYVKSNFNFKLKEKTNIVSEIKIIITEFITNNVLIENSIIEEIFAMPHSKKNLCPNLGAWIQKEITAEIILEAIKKKENLLSNYNNLECSSQWLLIVIGSGGGSSYNMDENIKIEIKSSFDKIYLLEDFYNTLYELK